MHIKMCESDLIHSSVLIPCSMQHDFNLNRNHVNANYLNVMFRFNGKCRRKNQQQNKKMQTNCNALNMCEVLKNNGFGCFCGMKKEHPSQIKSEKII